MMEDLLLVLLQTSTLTHTVTCSLNRRWLRRNQPIRRRRTDSPSPLDSMRDAVLTVSPNRQYLGIFRPTTPAHTGPARGKVNTLLLGANQTLLQMRLTKSDSAKWQWTLCSHGCSVSWMGNSQSQRHCSRCWKLQTARDKMSGAVFMFAHSVHFD